MVGRAARETVSACIIARDEEQRLPAALASVAFCDEVVVVDSGSSDATVAIARAAGATVLEHPWRGFGAQRNVAIDAATCDWILEVDADERVTGELRDEILRFLASAPPDVHLCVLPLRHRFLGAPLGPSAKYPAYRSRLFRRTRYRHDEARLVHEGVWPLERTVALRGDLAHELAGSWREALGDAWAYARLESGHVARPAGPASLVRAALARPIAKAGYRAVVDGGWRDGRRGLVKIALDSASDSVIALRSASGRVPPERPPEGSHFGRLVLRTGPVRLVAVALGRSRRARALDWLDAAHAAGADVALVTDADVARDGYALHVERIDGGGPLRLLRAVDAVAQMRPVDQLVLDARTARWLPRVLNAGARGAVEPASLDDDPRATVTALARSARGQAA